MRHQLMAALSVTVLLLGATGCSGNDEGGGSDDEEKAVSAIVDGMTTAESADSVRVQNQCVAEGLVDSMGVAGLRDAGLIDEDYVAQLSDRLDVATATLIADQVVACWDVEAQVADYRPAYPKATDADWANYVTCMDRLEPLVRAYAIASYTQVGLGQAQSRLATRTQRCITPLGTAVAPSG
jgi:hypothetical protein